MGTTRKFLRNMDKVTMSNLGKATKLQKVVSAVTAMGFVLQPVAAMASVVTNITPVNGGATVEAGSNSNVTNIWAGAVVGDVAMNVFKQFDVGANHIANMYFKKKEGNTEANNLVNMVGQKININGTVNAIRNSKIGGNLYFLSSNGIAVGAGGVVNAGSLTLMTPSDRFMKSALAAAGTDGAVTDGVNGLINLFDDSTTVNFDGLEQAYLIKHWKEFENMSVAMNKSGTITVNGTINTIDGIRMKAAHINIGKNENGSNATAKAVLNSGIVDFSNIVNINNVNSGTVKNALGNDLKAEMTGDGNIVLAAVANTVNENTNFAGLAGQNVQGNDTVQATINIGAGTQIIANEYIKTKEDNTTENVRGGIDISATATSGSGEAGLLGVDIEGTTIADILGSKIVKTDAQINIDGTLTADTINIAANAENSFEKGSLTEVGGLVEKGLELAGGIIPLDQLNSVTENVKIGYAKLASNAAVNIGSNATLTATGDAKLDAKANDDGLREGGALNISAISKISAEVGAEVEAEEGGEEAGQGKAAGATTPTSGNKKNNNSLSKIMPGAGVSVVDTDNSASVTIAGTLNSSGDANVSAHALSEVEAEAGVSTIDSEEGSQYVNAAVVVANINNASNVTLNGTTEVDGEFNALAAAQNEVTTAATAETDKDALASTAINVTKANSHADLTIGADIDAGSMNLAAENTVSNEIQAATQVGKSKFQTKSEMSGGALNAILGKVNAKTNKNNNKIEGGIGKYVTAGAAVNIVDETNSAKVTVKKGAKLTSNGDINIAANNTIEDSFMSATSVVNNFGGNKGNTTTNGNVTTGGTTEPALLASVGLLQADMDNNAQIVIEGSDEQGTSAPVIKGAHVNINANSAFEYDRFGSMVENLKEDYNDILKKYKDVLGDIQTLGTPLAEINKYLSNPSVDGAMDVAESFQNAVDTISLAYVDIPGGIPEDLNTMLEDILAFIDVSNYSNFYTAASTAGGNATGKAGGSGTGSGQAKVAATGSINLNSIKNNAQVIVGKGAIIEANAKDKNGKQIGELNISATAKQHDVALNGKTKYFIPKVSNTSGASTAIGGSVGVHDADVNSLVVIGEGAKLSGNDVNLKAENDLQHTAITFGGGKATNDGITGMFAYMEGESNSIISVDDEASINAANKLALNANNDTTISNIIFDRTSAGNTAIGASIGIVDYKVNNIAAIADNDSDATAKRDKVENLHSLVYDQLTGKDKDGNITEGLNAELGKKGTNETKGTITANEVEINAATTGTITGVSVAGVTAGATQKAGSTGSSSNSGGLKLPAQLAGAGSASVNIIKGNTAALLEGVNVNSIGADKTVSVSASDDSMIGAYSGAAAFKKRAKAGSSASGLSGTLAGAIAYNDVNTGVTAQIKDASIKNAAKITNIAVREGAVVAAGLALGVDMSGTTGSGGTKINAAASGSFNDIDNTVHAVLDNVNINDNNASGGDKTDIANIAQDKDIQVAGGITAQYAKGGVGAGVAASYQNANNDIQSKIIGGNLNNVGNLQAYAASQLVQVGTAVSVGVLSGQSANGVEGAVAINNLTNNVGVTIESATINAESVDAKAFDGKVTTSEAANKHLETLKNDGFDVDAADAMADVNVDEKGSDVEYNTSKIGTTESAKDEHGNVKENEDITEVTKNVATTGSNKFNANDNKGNLIITGATSVNVNASSNGTITAGASVATNNIYNSFNTKITGATITTSGTNGVSAKAESDTLMVGVAAGVAAAKGQNGGVAAGSASVMQLKNNTTATIENSTLTTDKVDVDATTTSRLINVAGQVSAGKGYAAVGLAGATNVLNNTTGAYIKGSTINAANNTNGVEIKANADNNSKAYAIVGAVTVATNQSSVAANGTVAVNKGTNDTEAIIDTAAVTENSTEKQKENTFTNVKSINVNAKADTTMKAIAGGVVVGRGYASVGGAVAYNEIGDFTSNKKQNTVARLNNAAITTVKDSTISVNAEDKSNLLTIAAGVSVSAGQTGAAAQGSAATALVNKNTEASMTGTSVSKNNANDNDGANIDVNAKTESSIITSADSISATTANAAGGAGVAVNRTEMDTKAFIDGGNAKKTISAKSVGVKAESKADILNIGIGAAVTTGQGGSVAGNVSVNNIDNDTEAGIKNAIINTKDNTTVLAKSSEHIKNYAGALAATVGQGYVAGGASVAVNTITGNTGAKVENATINAGNGSEIDFAGKKAKGLVVAADSDHEIDNVVVTAGMAVSSEVGVAASGTVAVNTIKGTTSAEINNSNTNTSGTAGDVNVIADDSTDINSAVGALAVGVGGATAGVAAGASSDTNVLGRAVTAKIEGTSNDSRNTVNANELNVNANSNNEVVTTAVGAAAAGGLYGAAGVAGTVSVTKTEAQTLAKVSNISSANNGFAIDASRNNQITLTGTSVAAAGGIGGVAVGMSVGVLSDESHTEAQLINANITHTNANAVDTIHAANSTNVTTAIVSAAGAAAIGGAAAGVVGVNNFKNTVKTVVSGSEIANSSNAASTINIDATNNITTNFNTATAAASVGAGAVGVGVNTIDTSVVTEVTDSKLKANNVNIAATETRDITQRAINAAAGGVALGSNVLITNIGTAIQDTYSANGADISMTGVLGNVNDTLGKQNTGNTNLASNATKGMLGSDTDITVGFDEQLKHADENQNENSTAFGNANVNTTTGLKAENTSAGLTAVGRGGNETAQGVQVKIDKSSEITATNKADIKAETNTDTNITAGGATAGGMAASGTFSILNVKRNSGVTVKNSTIAAKEIAIASKQAGTANMNIYQGTAGGTAVNVAVGIANLTGANKVELDEAILKDAETVEVKAEDASKVNTNAVGVTVGAVSLGAIAAVAGNESTNDIVIKSSNVTSKNINVLADKQNSVTAHATGGSAGMVSGSAIVATATDRGTSNITLGAKNGTLENTFNANVLNLNAKASPAVKALADSASVALTYGASAAIATATAEGSANVTVNDGNELLVDEANIKADIYTQDGEYTAEAKAEGNSGGGLVNVGANIATATTNTTSNVTVGAIKGKTKNVVTGTKTVYDATGKATVTNVEKTVGTTALNIESNNSTTNFADARGVNIGGVFSSGNNKAHTNNTSTTSASFNAGNNELLLGSLNVAASGAGDNLATADGSGGGLVSADLAAYVENRMAANTTTTVNGKLNVNGDVTINAFQNDRANLNADATKATVVGASATKAENDIQGTTTVALDGLTLVGTGNLDVNADNTVTVGDSKKYAVEGSGYGGVSVQGAEFDNTVRKAATINLGNAKITTAGTQGYEAKTAANVTAGGYIKAAGAGAFTWVDVGNAVEANDSIALASGAKLKTTKAGQDITLAAVDNMNINAVGVADTQGAAVGGASSDVTNTTTRNNSITMANGAEIYSMNDANLYTGRDKNGADGKLNLNVDSEAYNKTALGFSKPKFTDSIVQNNNIQLQANSNLASVRNINLYAEAGQETVRETSVMYSWYYSDKNENYTSSTIGDKAPASKTSDNYIQADGKLTAGVQNKQYFTIGKDGELVFLDKDVRDGIYANNGTTSVDEAQLRKDITASDGVNKNDIIIGTMDYGTTLFERYEQVCKLMNEYNEDTNSAAYLGYAAEKVRLFNELNDMGLVQAITDNNGQIIDYAPVKGTTIDYISLPDVVASGGNINIITDKLTGSGSMEAKGAPEVTINNNTNLYMKINNITVGDVGGEINYNGIGLKNNDNAAIKNLNKDGVAAGFNSIKVDADGKKDGTITINGNYGGSIIQAKVKITDDNGSEKEQVIETKPRSDIEINGFVNAKKGAVNITSKANNIVIQGADAASSAGVSGNEVHLTAASGSVSQGYTDGITSIGGDVQKQYKDQYDNIKGQYPGNQSENQHVVREGTAETDLSGNMIVGENIYINASDININGYMQSGYADYEATIPDSADLHNKITNIKNNYKGGTLSDTLVTTGTKYRVVEGKNVWDDATGSYKRQLDVYYNPSTGKLVVPDVDANGGKIYLTGRISSTGGGTIKAIDGAYDVTVNNKTNNDLQLGRLVSNSSAGLIRITDTGKATYGKDGKVISKGKVTEITRSGAKEYDIADINKEHGTDVSNNAYNPQEGLRYNWTTGQKVSTTSKYEHTIKAGLWGAVKTLDQSQLAAFEKTVEDTTTTTSESKNKPNGEYIGSNGKATGDFSVIYDNNVLSNTRVGPGEPERWSTGFLGWFKWERYSWETGSVTSQTYVGSVKADKEINIGFIGHKEGNINVSSNGSIDIKGKLGSTAGGSINLASNNGSITQTGVNMVSDNVSLKASTGINNIGITSIGDTVKLAASNTNSGDIDITVAGAYGKAGNVEIASITKPNLNAAGTETIANIVNSGTGMVKLVADGNINQSTSGAAIEGSRIDIVSNNGAIGNENDTLKIKAGTQVVDATDSLSASINANAKEGINLTQTDGDMRVGQIKSAQGDVAITVTNGNLVDALPDGEVIDRGDTDALIQKWKDLGLIANDDGTYTATEKQKQDVEDYKNNVKDEYNRYNELKGYYGNNSFTSEEQTAYNAYESAKTQYDSLTKEFKDYQSNKVYYTDESNIPKADKYRTTADYEKALAQYNDGKAAFTELETKCQSYTDANTYAQNSMTAEAWNNYNNPTVDGKDMKSTFGSYDSYLDLQARYENYNSAEDYLASDTATKHIEALQAAGAQWNKDQLLYAIQDSIINRDGAASENVNKEANLVGTNINIKAKNVGLDSNDSKTYTFAQLTSSIAALKDLASAAASTVTWNKNAKTATINPKLPVGIKASGVINVEATDNVYISGRKDDPTSGKDSALNIGQIKTQGNVRLMSHAGIYNKYTGADAAITGNNLLLMGGDSGSVGTSNKLLTTNMKGTVDVSGTEGVYLQQIGSNNPLQLVAVASNGDLVLKADGNIVSTKDANTEAQGYVKANGAITIDADGDIGTDEYELRIKNADDADTANTVTITAGKGVNVKGVSTSGIAGNAQGTLKVAGITAANGNTKLDVDGNLAANGAVSATGAINMNAENNVAINDTVTAVKGIDVAAGADLNVNGSVNNNASGNITMTAEKNIDINASIKNTDTNDALQDNANIILSARNNVNLNENANLKAKKVNLVASAVRNTGETPATGAITQAKNSQIIADKVVAAAMNGIDLSSEKNTLHTVDVANMDAGDINIANDGSTDKLTVIIAHENNGNITLHNYQKDSKTSDMKVESQVKAAGTVNFINDAGSIKLPDQATYQSEYVKFGNLQTYSNSFAVQAVKTINITAKNGSVTNSAGISSNEEDVVITTSTGTGDVNNTGAVTGKSISITTDQGNITSSGMLTSTVGDVTANTNSGDIKMNSAIDSAKDVVLETKAGSITINDVIKANRQVKANATKGLTAEKSITSVTDNILLTTTDGDLITKDNVIARVGNVNLKANAGKINSANYIEAGHNAILNAKTDIDVSHVDAQNDASLTAETGSITANTVKSAQGKLKLNAGTSITTRGAVEATVGDVSYEANKGIIAKDKITSGNNVSIINKDTGDITAESGAAINAGHDVELKNNVGSIIANGGITAVRNSILTTGNGNISTNGNVKAEAGDVSYTVTEQGNITTGGTVEAGSNVSMVTKDGSITAKGNVNAGNDVNMTNEGIGDITAESGAAINAGHDVALTNNNGNILTGNTVTVRQGNASFNVDKNGNITTYAKVNANKDITYNAKGSITTGGSIESNSGNIALTTDSNVGNMSFNGDITTGQGSINIKAKQNGDMYYNGNVKTANGNIDILIEGNGNIDDTDKLFEAKGAKCVAGAGHIKMQIKGAGDVDLGEIFATNKASVDIYGDTSYPDKAGIRLAKIDGYVVAIQLRAEGKDMDVDEIVAGKKITTKGSNLNLGKITQRSTDDNIDRPCATTDGILSIVPDGAKDDAPIDNLHIGEIASNSGVRFEHLWLNKGNIHVNDGKFHIDKLVVNDNAHFSNNHMTTAVWGNPPQRDYSNGVFWNNTALNNPGQNLDEWINKAGTNAEKWMFLHFTETPNIQHSNGNLLDLRNYDYVYNQRFTAFDHLHQLLTENKADEYEISVEPEIVYYFRYYLYDLEETEHHANPSKVVIEA